MKYLAPSILNYHSKSFKINLKNYIEQLSSDTLTLNKYTTQGGIIDDDNISATILSINDAEHSIEAKVGIFFTEIVGGCSCGDDPVSVNAYCEIMAIINKQPKHVSFSVIDE